MLQIVVEMRFSQKLTISRANNKYIFFHENIAGLGKKMSVTGKNVTAHIFVINMAYVAPYRKYIEIDNKL